MTYEERIEAMARAMGASEPGWNFGVHWAMNPPNRQRLLNMARAADAACLAALEEPTEEMIMQGAVAPAADDGGANSEVIWHEMWSAIPRGDK